MTDWPRTSCRTTPLAKTPSVAPENATLSTTSPEYTVVRKQDDDVKNDVKWPWEFYARTAFTKRKTHPTTTTTEQFALWFWFVFVSTVYAFDVRPTPPKCAPVEVPTLFRRRIFDRVGAPIIAPWKILTVFWTPYYDTSSRWSIRWLSGRCQSSGSGCCRATRGVRAFLS